MVDSFQLQKWINRKYNCFNYFYIHKFKKWKNIKSLKIIKCFESKICVSFSQILSQLFTVIYAFLQCHNYAFSHNSIWQICLKSFYYFGHSPDLSGFSESISLTQTYGFHEWRFITQTLLNWFQKSLKLQFDSLNKQAS